jgi:hypothetical protein
VADAFAVADNIHKESWSSNNWNEPCFADPGTEKVLKDDSDAEDGDSANFDPHALEDAIRRF